jgi:hypothetical protein
MGTPHQRENRRSADGTPLHRGVPILWFYLTHRDTAPAG